MGIEDKTNNNSDESDEIKFSDLDLLERGKSHQQKESSPIRRAIARALRKNRKVGPDDGDTLGLSSVFRNNPFKKED